MRHLSQPAQKARRRSQRRFPLLALCCLLITGYFAQHAINGKHGLEARSRLQQRAERVSGDVKRLEVEVKRLQREVALLITEPPDADFVREIATDVLGLIPADGFMVIRPKPTR